MKKKTGAMYLLYFLCAAIVLASGCDKLSSSKPEKISGTVISLDEAKKEIVMKDSSSGKQRTITVQNADQMAALKPGMGIKVKIKHGATMADKVTPMAQKDSGKKGKQKAGEE
jgi:lipopolysaccharide export system protein LptA